MKLYLVRHGQSETNLTQCYTGWAQVSLTEQGFADAARAGSRLAGLHFDRIYSSDLLRAIQTAQTALPGCKPIERTELREISLGALELRPFDECRRTLGADFPAHLESRSFACYGGEDYEVFFARVARFFRSLEDDPCDQAVAFAHAGVMQCALDFVLNARLDRSRLRCANGSIAVFSYENGRWLLESWGL